MIRQGLFLRIPTSDSASMSGRLCAFVTLTVLTMSLLGGCSSPGSTSQSSALSQPVVPPSGSNAGSFTITGSMNTARANHTATLLPNGKVLIAGVSVGLQPQLLATAELYDPSTGRFTPTGSMNTPRGHAAAVLLASGKVLITGGGQDLSAELYDPSSGTFATTGNVISGGVSNFVQVPATMLQDGRVLVEGLNAEIYDPSIGTFAATVAYLDANPLWYTATLLLDGRVLNTGCTVSCSAGATELFDPKTTTFSTTGTMKGWANVNTATLLLNGKVLFVGNAENDGSPGDAELYDPATGTFTSLGTTTAPHEFAAAVRLPDGTVFIAGGQLPGGSGSTGTDLYDPASGNFTSGGNMTTGRHEHTATLLPDGTVLIVGGYSGWPNPTSSAEVYKYAAIH